MVSNSKSVVSLTRDELDRLLAVAKKYSFQDFLMFLVTFNHGLRVSETLALTPENLQGSFLVVQRLKGSFKTTQPLLASEREFLSLLTGRWFPMSRWTFGRRMHEYGKEAGIPDFKCHPHSLKHTTGRLGFTGGMTVTDVASYLGHKVMENSLVYMRSTEEESARAFAAGAGR